MEGKDVDSTWSREKYLKVFFLKKIFAREAYSCVEAPLGGERNISKNLNNQKSSIFV